MSDDRSHLHDPYIVRCAECGRQLDLRYENPWDKVQGWDRKRAAGGTNHLALRKPLGEFMCNGCMEKLLSGVAITQLTLGG